MKPMKREKIKLWPLAFAIFMFSCFGFALADFERGRAEENVSRLEEAAHRCAVACYASEGFYPSTAEYLEQHYGLTYDKSQYMLQYEFYASNLMPEITALKKQP